MRRIFWKNLSSREELIFEHVARYTPMSVFINTSRASIGLQGFPLVRSMEAAGFSTLLIIDDLRFDSDLAALLRKPLPKAPAAIAK